MSLFAIPSHASPLISTFNNEINNSSHTSSSIQQQQTINEPFNNQLRLSSETILQIERELLFLEQIRPRIVEEELYIDGTIVDTNKALSNLAFLDLSDEERDELTAKYRALNHQVNEVDELIDDELDADDIRHLDPMILD